MFTPRESPAGIPNILPRLPEQPRQAPNAGPRRPLGMLFFVTHCI